MPTAVDPLPAQLLGLVPNLLATLTITVVVALWLAPRLETSRWVAAMWLATLLVPLAYTWTPAWGFAGETCDWGVWPWSGAQTRIFYEMFTNIVLLVPAGAAVWLWSAGARRLTALVIALALPTTIETVQRWAPQLDSRACQASDVVFNIMGVWIGFGAVAAVVAVHNSWSLMLRDRTEA